MKKVTLYKCEHCEYSSTDIHECLKHEAEHYNLTLEQYQEWRELRESAGRAGSIVGSTKNYETERNFDRAIERLVEFEHKYDLIGKKQPLL